MTDGVIYTPPPIGQDPTKQRCQSHPVRNPFENPHITNFAAGYCENSPAITSRQSFRPAWGPAGFKLTDG